jgi:hypothetical protein|tara:strand:+ start:1507 stop:1779 length:273 start_codon:yes stop_codon:yes gene_type:complete
MVKSTKQELATKAAYNKKPSVQKKRVANNKARREGIKSGRVKKGDGKHIDHTVPLDAGGSTAKSNTRVVSAAANQGWRGKNPGMYTKGSK